MEEKINTELVKSIRIDKNLAYGILDFKKIEDTKTRALLKSLLLYFSFQYEKDLFGYGELDPSTFCKMFNYDKTNLLRKVDDSQCLSPNLNDSTTWNNFLENALYILATTPIFEEYRGQDENYKIIGMKNYIILNEIYKYSPNTKNKGKKKRYYKYVLDKTFETNLKKFFLNIDFKKYLETRKWNGDDFYLQLMNIINQSKSNKTNSYYWTVESLKDFFNIQHKEIRVVKQRIKVILKKYEDLLKDDIKGFQIDWIKTGAQKFPYTVQISWEHEEIEKQQEQKRIVLEQLFLDIFKRNLYDEYLKAGNLDLETTSFYRWIYSKKNSEIFISTYKKIKSDLDKTQKWGADSWATNFYKKIRKCKTVEEITNCFIAK